MMRNLVTCGLGVWLFAVLGGWVTEVCAAERAHVCRYCAEGLHAKPDLEIGRLPANGRHYAPDRLVDILHIKLDVTPDFAKRTVKGTATLRFVPISRPLDSLRLDGIHLDVHAVRSSATVRDWSVDSENVTIVFDPPIAVGKEATVDVDYSAEPRKGLYFRTPEMGYPESDTHCWTQGETHEARHWFPCFDFPHEKSSTEIVCHVPQDMTAVSNGRLLSEAVDAKSGLKTVHWLQEKPHANYLICLIAGKFTKLEGRHGDLPLGFYTQPSLAEYAPKAFANTADIMAFFEKEIGVPYPWEEYDQATITEFTWGGMENTTLTTLSQRTLHGEDVENLQERGTRSLDAHELAHQWFGDYVTCKDWSHLWLNEGFATYYTELYEGHKCGRDAMLHRLYESAEKILSHNGDKRPIVYRRYQTAQEQFDYRNYPKAGWVLHMLRSHVGEDLYRQAICTYLARHAYSSVETEDLRNVFEEISGQTLDKFFDQWLYHGGTPELRVTYKWLAKEKMALVTIEQTHKVDDDVLLFELPTKLRFVVDGKTIDEPITLSEKMQQYFVRLPGEPKIVRFDPEYTLLTRVDFELSDKMLKAQLKESDVIGRLQACKALAKRKTGGSVEALTAALQGDAFFGVREAAAAALQKIGSDEAIAALLANTQAEDARVRLAVIEEIGKCYKETVQQKLIETLEAEKNPQIVAAAIAGLAKYADEKSVAAVKTGLAKKSCHDEATEAAFEAIIDLNATGLAETLMETLKTRSGELTPQVLASGLSTLAKISREGKHRDAAYAFLTGYLNHPRMGLRRGAILALGELRDPRAKAVLATMSDAEDPLAVAITRARESLERETPAAAEEVVQLRKEIRELQKSLEAQQKAIDELKAKGAVKSDAKEK